VVSPFPQQLSGLFGNIEVLQAIRFLLPEDDPYPGVLVPYFRSFQFVDITPSQSYQATEQKSIFKYGVVTPGFSQGLQF
jgi:hypothetical protein